MSDEPSEEQRRSTERLAKRIADRRREIQEKWDQIGKPPAAAFDRLAEQIAANEERARRQTAERETAWKGVLDNVNPDQRVFL